MEGHEFQHFYRVLFSDRVACVVLGALGTLMGEFEYWQREYAFGWGEGRWNRSNVCHHWREALRLLRRDGCNAINMGGMFSRLGGQMGGPQAALSPYDLAAAPVGPAGAAGSKAPGPRDWERKVFHDGCGTPAGGEMVIDVDLDDQLVGMYNRKGICECAGKKRTVCEVCWHLFMDPAQVAMEFLLAHHGIRKYIMYFSGRRGFHCMILEPWVIHMTNDERARLMHVLNTPPIPQSELGRAMYDLLAPYVEAHPVLKSRCLPSPGPGATGLTYEGVMRELYPKMDVPVGADASHLHGVPLTLHPETRVLRIIIGSARDERTRFYYKYHRFDVDALTQNPNHIMWGCALRILQVLMGPNAEMSPAEYVEHALREGGHVTSKSEALN